MALPPPPSPSDHAAPADLTGTSVGRFTILSRLGSGGMGEVYLAEDTILKRRVALKRIAPALREDPGHRHKFLKEAERASRLNHPHIAAIYDVLQEQGGLYLIMEFVEGETLRQRLGRPLSVPTAVTIAAECASALAAAHEQNIVHCDIKPENIMITKDGEAKVLDFGVARHLPGPDERATSENLAETAAGTGGTITYMAPEVMLGDAPSPQSDLFSLGVVIFEMLGGKHPFRAGSVLATSNRILHDRPAQLSRLNPQVPLELQAVVERFLAKKPAERYPSSAEAAADLHALERGRRPPGVPSLSSSARTRLVLFQFNPATLLVVAVLVVLLGAGIWFWRRPAARAAPFSERDWVVIGEFSNQSGQPHLDLTLRDALAYELDQSPYVNVLPRPRVVEALARMKLPADTPLTEDVGRELCAREGLKALLLGSVSKVGDQYLIAAKVLNASSGVLLASDQQVVSQISDSLAATRRLAQNLRKQVGESLASIQANISPIPKVTSSSFEAVQQFAQGRQLMYQGLPRDALPFFLQALDLDPQFAMAHHYAAIVYAQLDDFKNAEKHLQRAVDLASQTGPRERYQILADYYSFLGDNDRAVAEYDLLTSRYPDDPVGHAHLGETYGDLLRFDKAVHELQVAVHLAPSPRLRSLLAEMQFQKGDPQAAIDLEKQNLRANPAAVSSWIALAQYQIALEQFSEAQSALDHAANFPADSEQADLILTRADLALSQGRFQQALEILQDGLSAAGGRSDPGAWSLLLRRAQVWLLLEKPSKAQADLRAVPDQPGRWSRWLPKGILAARAGDLPTAQACLRLLEQKLARHPNPTAESHVRQLRAEVELSRGAANDAVVDASEAVRRYPSTFALATLARAQRAAGRRQEAIASLQTLQARADEGAMEDPNPPTNFEVVLQKYDLARLLEEDGQREKALACYRDFLNLWKGADPDLPVLRDATRRAAQGAQ
jgi:eukaryotic-like serine/threonine-protein kinase